ncbi:hypothetical protein [Myroides fluvii]|uniref:hypothetical protein n=1 Tax=Myroides fluvii TaxID=2572594 RepID=UPI00131D3498|nr:hypothetical protein [Myroides fluvii]
MNPKNKEIRLTGAEALQIIASLDQFVQSVDKIRAYHADPRKNKTQEEQQKALATYISEPEVTYNSALAINNPNTQKVKELLASI